MGNIPYNYFSIYLETKQITFKKMYKSGLHDQFTIDYLWYLCSELYKPDPRH